MQAAAIEGEDFEAAAVLDVRLGELGGQRDALQARAEPFVFCIGGQSSVALHVGWGNQVG